MVNDRRIAPEVTPIEVDRLWTDRIRKERDSRNRWPEFFSYLVKGGVPNQDELLFNLTQELGSDGASYKNFRTTTQDAYRPRKNLEGIFNKQSSNIYSRKRRSAWM
eukprot:NODE_11130_length_471_cov_12.591954_g10475_i0.p1 GENE.NODE_11130_length_471_cov_12.591954_g10475_i0~~NODE_11130_length_471_cov_12.591954_g10475_i0.p1  ORF type:complete len:118 (-),score=13.93 NODE_11130_length_471_cov_12.591954_g10475_i0:117-434(-)